MFRQVVRSIPNIESKQAGRRGSHSHMEPLHAVLIRLPPGVGVALAVHCLSMRFLDFGALLHTRIPTAW